MDAFKDFLINKFDYGDTQLGQIEHIVEIVNLQKKDYLIKEGKVCSFIGFIEEGILRSYIQKGSNEFNVDFFLPSSFISSYTSFLTQLPTNTNIQALSNVKIYTISFANYNNLLKTSTDWYVLGKFIADSFFIKKCKREKSLLIDSAGERYKLLLRTYPQIEQLVAQYHIASYLGIKPESLSRIKSLTYINKKK